MAQLHGGFLGTISGALGDVVFTTRNGKQYVRARRVPTGKPASPKQAAQQNKLTTGSRFIASMSKLVSVTFYEQRRKGTPYSQALKVNSHCIIKTGEGVHINYASVVVSKGSVVPPWGAKLAVENGVLQFTWDADRDSSRSWPDDKAIVVAHCPAQNVTIHGIGPAGRADQRATLDVSAFKGHEVHTWLAFCAANERKSSNSRYMGQVQL